ncbi:hemolysin-III related-domain-containing protein [Rhexocercosporidium sp. MPI-PUGE-AT-0058]|nr:hemolysin-III related-domain-containing protein [Rhexocercosporidium sp. MPI-PUGE-AT-0058]
MGLQEGAFSDVVVVRRKSKDAAETTALPAASGLANANAALRGGESAALLQRVRLPMPLRLWGELEVWQQEDNHLIETGYRSATGSLSTCFASWRYIHNETVNIYSHLIGSAIFIVIPVYLFKNEIPPRYAVATWQDVVVCLTYFLGVAICFCLSAIYHTVMCHSRSVDLFGAQLDFQGVILLMWSATIPLVFYGFHCDRALRNAYWTMLSVLAAICSISTFHSRFQEPFLRPVRAATFGSLGLFTMVPVFHGIQERMGHAEPTNGNNLGAHNTCLERPRGHSIRPQDSRAVV